MCKSKGHNEECGTMTYGYLVSAMVIAGVDPVNPIHSNITTSAQSLSTSLLSCKFPTFPFIHGYGYDHANCSFKKDWDGMINKVMGSGLEALSPLLLENFGE